MFCTKERHIYPTILRHRKLLQEIHQEFLQSGQANGEVIKKDVPYVWVEECQTSFQALKEALVGSKVMAYPKDQETYILDIDASDSAIGAVLNQEQDRREKLIAFGSRTLNKAEANYCVTDKELSIRYFGEYYHQYLLCKRFIERTEHQALVWLLKLREPKGRKAL